MMHTPKGIERKIAKIQFGHEARKDLYNQMISLIRSGISTTEALRMIWDITSMEGKKPREAIPMIVADVIEGLKEGKTFGQSLAYWLPREELMVIEALENSSDFASNLEEYLELSSKKRGIRSKIVGGLAYPVFLLSIVFGVIVYFGKNVVPQIANIMPPEQWTGPAAALRWMAHFAENYTVPVLVGLIVTLIAVWITLPRWCASGRKYADKLPLYSTYRMYSGISFLTSVAALSRSGVPVVTAIRKIRMNATPYVRHRLDMVLRGMLDGQNFGSALYRAGTGWPDDKMSLGIKIFAETQDLSIHLSRMSREWLELSEQAITRNMSLLRSLSMVLMFGVIMTIIGGIYSLNTQLSSGAF